MVSLLKPYDMVMAMIMKLAMIMIMMVRLSDRQSYSARSNQICRSSTGHEESSPHALHNTQNEQQHVSRSDYYKIKNAQKE